jgi:hypothetical protein
MVEGAGVASIFGLLMFGAARSRVRDLYTHNK